MRLRHVAIFGAALAAALNCKPRRDATVKDDDEPPPAEEEQATDEAAILAAGALDVNDVSILFPKGSSPGSFYPPVDITQVMPKATFDSMMRFAQGKTMVDTGDQGTVHFAQFILPPKYDAIAAAALAKAGVTAPDATKIKILANDDADTRAGKEVALEIALGRVTCAPIAGSRSKLCTDKFAVLNFDGHRDGILDMSQWRIVGMRMDLCAGAHTAKTAQCEVEFRLIAQPAGDFPPIPPASFGAPAPNSARAPGARGPFMFDTSAHLIYKVGFLDLASGNITATAGGRDVVTTAGDIIRDLQSIKAASPVDTNGKPLGVHPGLAAEIQGTGKSDTRGTIATTVRQVITKYTRSGAAFKLTNVTTMQLAGPVNFDSSVWVFFQGIVDKNAGNAWIPSPITGGEGIWSIRSASVVGKTGRFFPPTELHSKSKAIDPIFDFELNQPLKGPQQDLPSFFDNPGRYGDPDINVADTPAASVRNTDCISCHMTAPRAIERTIKSTDGRGTPRPSLYQPPVGTTAYVALNALPRVDYSLRNFGYFLAPPFKPNLKGTETGTPGIFNFPGTRVETPAVMPRVAMESAELVNLINSRFLKLPNPGLTCKDENPQAALAAATPATKVFSDASQAIIRRDSKAHAAVFDCMLHEGFKRGGSFEECTARCGATANTVAKAAGGPIQDNNTAGAAGGTAKKISANMRCQLAAGLWRPIFSNGGTFASGLMGKNAKIVSVDVGFLDEAECKRAIATSANDRICLRVNFVLTSGTKAGDYVAFEISTRRENLFGLDTLDQCNLQAPSAKFDDD